MKHSKLKTGIMIVLSLFFLLSFCSCSSSNDSIETDTPVNPKPSEVKVMDKSKIANYGKYYCPDTWNEGFEKGPDYMLRSDARWSWWRMKQSEHFFVFWDLDLEMILMLNLYRRLCVWILMTCCRRLSSSIRPM